MNKYQAIQDELEKPCCDQCKRLDVGIAWWKDALETLKKEYFAKAKLMSKEERMENLEFQQQSNAVVLSLEAVKDGSN